MTTTTTTASPTLPLSSSLKTYTQCTRLCESFKDAFILRCFNRDEASRVASMLTDDMQTLPNTFGLNGLTFDTYQQIRSVWCDQRYMLRKILPVFARNKKDHTIGNLCVAISDQSSSISPRILVSEFSFKVPVLQILPEMYNDFIDNWASLDGVLSRHMVDLFRLATVNHGDHYNNVRDIFEDTLTKIQTSNNPIITTTTTNVAVETADNGFVKVGRDGDSNDAIVVPINDAIVPVTSAEWGSVIQLYKAKSKELSDQIETLTSRNETLESDEALRIERVKELDALAWRSSQDVICLPMFDKTVQSVSNALIGWWSMCEEVRVSFKTLDGVPIAMSTVNVLSKTPRNSDTNCFALYHSTSNPSNGTYVMMETNEFDAVFSNPTRIRLADSPMAFIALKFDKPVRVHIETSRKTLNLRASELNTTVVLENVNVHGIPCSVTMGM